jgi:hypothetical protein
MIALFHPIVAHVSEFVRGAIARVCNLYRAVILRTRTTLAAIVRFLGG